MKKFITNKNVYSVILSVVLSFAFVTVSVFASSTISTNISTDGTLTVSGITTANGALHASTTLVVTGATTLYGTTTIMAQPLVLGMMATSPNGQTEGTIFYDSTNKIIKLYDGASWFTVATSTGGMVLSGSRIAFSDLTTNYVTLGTTTPVGASVMTLEATSTLAIPLSLRAFNGQTADLFKVWNVAGTELFALDKIGNASTSDISVSGNLWVDGYATTSASTGNIATEGTITANGNVTVGDAIGDTLTVNSGTISIGNTATTTIQDNKVNSWSIATSTSITPSLTINTNTDDANARIGINTVSPNTTFEVVGTASSTSLVVGGNSTNGTLAGMVFGTCNIVTKSIAATSTAGVKCASATGIRSGDTVFVQATSSLSSHLLVTSGDFVIVGASSTALNTIGVQMMNMTGDATSTYGTLRFWAVR